PHSHTHSSAPSLSSFFFFSTDPAPPDIYTLSLHDALPISLVRILEEELKIQITDAHETITAAAADTEIANSLNIPFLSPVMHVRSEEHTSELQSLTNLVCRLLLEKKKKTV